MKLHVKLNYKSMIVWMVTLSTMIIGFMAFYPTMADTSMQALIQGVPDSMLQVLGFEHFPDFSRIDVFYGYIMQYIMMGIAVYAIVLGLNTFSKEVTDGTIEFLYAQPITRTELIVQKLSANILILTGVSCVMILVSCFALGVFLPAGTVFSDLIIRSLPVFASFWLLALLFLVLGTGLSLILPTSLSTMGIAMGIVFIPYVLGMMAQMVDALSSFKFISILHTTMPDQIYAGTFNSLSIGLWTILTIGIFSFGLHHFKTRDINI
ncbi:ABC transporter permease subunit [Erysipelothrix anatis]|uniref:ABC transporter permease subunit n=1 Tax=Erysipelothrix anatis TaxID=2683713 RepID=UPI00135A5136|nr:ABC transporter permease subunit [Erysipelothrix anatis]